MLMESLWMAGAVEPTSALVVRRIVADYRSGQAEAEAKSTAPLREACISQPNLKASRAI